MAAAVDKRRFLDLLWYPVEHRLENPSADGDDESSVDDGQRRQVLGYLQLPIELVDRNDDHCFRHHLGEEQEKSEYRSTGPAQAGKWIGCERRKEDHEDCDEQTDFQRVEQPGGE